jgi:hypothetical protein
VILAPVSALLRAQPAASGDPWSSDQLLQPADLAASLKGASPPLVICVGFPVLYRQKHVAKALLAGPASKPEGIERLKGFVAATPRNANVVIYCGCCPMPHCPNLRPAFSLLKNSGFGSVRVLNLPTNFHTDWAAKGYPVESAIAPSTPAAG